MKKKRRILFLLDFFSFLGGTEYNNYNLAVGLTELGHEVRICVREQLSHYMWSDMLTKKGIPLYIGPHPYDPSGRLEEDDPFLTCVEDLIKSWQPDIIFAHPPGKLLISWLLRHTENKIPVLAMEYTVPGANTEAWHHPALQNVQPKISAYIAKCREEENGLRSYLGYTGMIYRLPNLVAKAAQNIKEQTGTLLSVGCIGRLSPEKGIGFLLGAWKCVLEKMPEAELHIYGHGAYKEYYLLLAQDLGIHAQVIFEGTFAPITGIDEIAQRHRIFVQPSLFEGVPNSLIELMMRKKAIVASAVGGVPELLRCGTGEGILVSPGSTDELARALMSLMGDEQMTEHMGQKAYERASEIYDYDRNIRAYEEIFLKVAGRI